MPRPTELLVNGKGHGLGRTAPMLDLVSGGQFGWMPNMPAYVSNSAYVRRNLIVRLIEAPLAFSYLPDAAKWYATLKTLIELHPRTVEGLQAGLEVQFEEHAFGGAGEIQSDVSKVTRQRSNPSFGYVEKYGRPINAFYAGWIQWLLQDPNTGAPLIATLGKGVQTLLPDDVGATVMFIEPDPTYSKVDKAWLVTNMMPKGDGPVEGRRDQTSAGNMNEFNIEFTGISQYGYGVNQYAQKLLDEMNLTGANPNARPAFTTQIQADIQAAANGYAEGIKNAARTAVSV